MMSHIVVLFLLTIGCLLQTRACKFPNHFKFGAATASHQIEGAWNEDGKSISNWNYFEHNIPNAIADNATADIACDSYHKYKEDVKLLKNLGVSTYRFSISWPRLLPSGYINKINEAGLKYYNNLINELLKNDIEPAVTIFHWDLPWNLQQLGGWTNELMIDYYLDYVRVLFDNFGDRVKLWITINEPRILCMMSYGGIMAPALNASGLADYVCGHNVLKAHAAAYHLYDKEYRAAQKGRIGVTLDTFWAVPKTNSKENVEAAERYLQFSLGWFAHPILSKSGDYPKIMKELIKKASHEQGFKKSRLPEFTKEEIENVKGSTDFLGINYYSTYLIENVNTGYDKHTIGYDNDKQTNESKDPSWPKSAADWLTDNPEGLRNILKYIKHNYHNPEVMITENGFADKGELCDVGRTKYYQGHFKAILDSIRLDNVNLTRYYAWSLIDDFEWISGYTLRFGLYYVNFDDPGRERKPKLSTVLYKTLTKERKITDTEINEEFCKKFKNGEFDDDQFCTSRATDGDFCK